MIASVVFIAIGLLLVAAGIGLYAGFKRRCDEGFHATALITSLQTVDDEDFGRECECWLRYTDQNGNEKTTILRGLKTSFAREHKQGDSIGIICDPKKPEEILRPWVSRGDRVLDVANALIMYGVMCIGFTLIVTLTS